MSTKSTDELQKELLAVAERLWLEAESRRNFLSAFMNTWTTCPKMIFGQLPARCWAKSC